MIHRWKRALTICVYSRSCVEWVFRESISLPKLKCPCHGNKSEIPSTLSLAQPAAGAISRWRSSNPQSAQISSMCAGIDPLYKLRRKYNEFWMYAAGRTDFEYVCGNTVRLSVLFRHSWKVIKMHRHIVVRCVALRRIGALCVCVCVSAVMPFAWPKQWCIVRQIKATLGRKNGSPT